MLIKRENCYTDSEEIETLLKPEYKIKSVMTRKPNLDNLDYDIDVLLLCDTFKVYEKMPEIVKYLSNLPPSLKYIVCSRSFYLDPYAYEQNSECEIEYPDNKIKLPHGCKMLYYVDYSGDEPDYEIYEEICKKYK